MVADQSIHERVLTTGQRAPTIPADVAAGLARSALRAERSDPVHLRGLADLCRRAGAVDEAFDLIALIHDQADQGDFINQHARLLNTGTSLATSRMSGPVPFVRRRDFLPLPDHDTIFNFLKLALPRFENSPLLRDGAEVLDSSRRRSVTLRQIEDVAELFDSPIRALIENIIPSVGVAISNKSARIDRHAQVYGDGDFFGPHRDAEINHNQNRIVSFVYYMCDSPRKFTGGELFIYDEQVDGGVFNAGQYSSIIPEDNSLIVFPSWACHEVRPTSLASLDVMNGRFSITGSLIQSLC